MSIKPNFSCALLVFSSYGYAAPLSDEATQPQAIATYFIRPVTEAGKTFDKLIHPGSSPKYKQRARLIYDNQILREQIIATSIFTHQQIGVFKTRLMDERYAGNADPLQINIHGNNPAFSATGQPKHSELISFYALLKGQSSPKNLDTPNKIEAGDIYASKYFPEKRIFTDQGYILDLEARINLPEFVERQSGLMQLIIFVDTNAIGASQFTWSESINHTTIKGAGIGMMWTYVNNFEVKVYLSSQLNNDVLSIAPDLSRSLWIQAVKYF